MSLSDDQTRFFGMKAGRFQTSVSGTFTGTGNGDTIKILGEFNVLISGGIGTVDVQRSFDAGATWYTISQDTAGTPASYTTGGSVAFNGVLEEHEGSMLYRLSCTGYTSGTITYRISQ